MFDNSNDSCVSTVCYTNRCRSMPCLLIFIECAGAAEDEAMQAEPVAP